MHERILSSEALTAVRRQRECGMAKASLPALGCAAGDVEDVVVILATSRGGSSLLFNLLSQSQKILSMDGEHAHLYKLNGLALSHGSHPCDQVTAGSPEALADLWSDIAFELRQGPARRSAADHSYRDVLQWRIFQQWSLLEIPDSTLSSCVDDTFVSMAASDAVRALTLLRDRLSAHGHHLSLPYYDGFPREPQLSAAQPPPVGSACIEEPPFVFPRPRAIPAAADVRCGPILLKASVDAFKVPLLKAVFPNARIRFIHLTRNPAASINGLRDGWLDRGFFSYNVGRVQPLCIGGYSDRFDWGRDWWCFDLPPGWERLVSSPLLEVCAYQWWRSHASMLDSIAGEAPGNVLRIRFEDVLSAPGQSIGRILRFIGLPADPDLERAAETAQPVMATAIPTRFRWKACYRELRSAVESPEVASLARELGYHHDRKDQWL